MLRVLSFGIKMLELLKSRIISEFENTLVKKTMLPRQIFLKSIADFCSLEGVFKLNTVIIHLLIKLECEKNCTVYKYNKMLYQYLIDITKTRCKKLTVL